MKAIDPPAPDRPCMRVHLRVVQLAEVVVGAHTWLPGPDDPATLRAVDRLRAVGSVLGGGAEGGTLLDPFLVDGRLRLVYGGDWLSALRRLRVTRAQVLVADGLPEDPSFRLLLAHLLRPIPATATPMEIHRAERPIRALISEAARARQRRGGLQTAAARWGSARADGLASADFPGAIGAPGLPPAAGAAPSAVADVLERAFEAVASRGAARTKHKLLGLTSSADEYEAIEKIVRAADDPDEADEVRAIASAQLAALDTAQPPAISTALRRVNEARHDAHARALRVAAEPPLESFPAPGADLIDALLAALQACVERVDALLTPRSAVAAAISRTDAGGPRLRAVADAAREIPQLISSVAEAV